MTGHDRRGIVLQARDRRLLEALAAMRVVDREQARMVAGFRSISRANVRLLALVRAGLLRRFFLGSSAAGRKALYSLSAKGAKLIGAPRRGPRRRNGEILVADAFVEHQLTVNEIHCALKFGSLPAGVAFRRWIAFFAPLTDTRLIPDGYVELSVGPETLAAFIEVDLGHESRIVWREKIRNYLDYALSGAHQRDFGQKTFRVLVIGRSDRRLRSIRDTAAKITEKLFSFAELGAIRANGFFAPIWQRMNGDRLQSLA